MAKYIITGLKLLLLSLVAFLVTYIYNFLLMIMATLFLGGFNAGTKYDWNLALSNPFFVIVFIVILIAYIFSLIYLNGYLAQKLWKWR